MDICFVDIETTGLDPRRHAIWDIGIIKLHDDGGTTSHQWYLNKVPLKRADPGALRIGHFYQRHPDYGRVATVGLPVSTPNAAVAEEVARLTADCIMAGNVVNFDTAFLEVFLRAYGLAPQWHYHLLDVEAFAAGFLGRTPPWKGTLLSDILGVKQPEEEHTALGDAQWAYDIYHAVMSQHNERAVAEQDEEGVSGPGEDLT